LEPNSSGYFSDGNQQFKNMAFIRLQPGVLDRPINGCVQQRHRINRKGIILSKKQKTDIRSKPRDTGKFIKRREIEK
jgi:hypothetical protein